MQSYPWGFRISGVVTRVEALAGRRVVAGDPGQTPGCEVRLHFAEIWWGVHVWGGVRSRVFGVSINGVPVLQNFDIYAAVGGAMRALIRQFAATADSAGRITIRYSSVKDYAKSSGIEVISGG